MSELTAKELAEIRKNRDDYWAAEGSPNLGDFITIRQFSCLIEMAEAVLDKPAPAGELGEAVKLAKETKDACENCRHFPKNECEVCAQAIGNLKDEYLFACHLLALAAENARLRGQGWTAVADGLPELPETSRCSECVLIYYINCTGRYVQNVGWLNRKDEHWPDSYPNIFWLDTQFEPRLPTHWRPLPEPPEMGETKEQRIAELKKRLDEVKREAADEKS